MNLRFLISALLCVTTSSCDKIKNLKDNASTTIETLIAKKLGESGAAAVDPELQKLVDQTPEGVIFRKDLPFPSQLQVTTIRQHELSSRFVEVSAIESHVSNVKGTETTGTKLERTVNQVRYSLEQSIFTESVLAGEEKQTKPVVRVLVTPSKPRTYKKSGSGWRADGGSDFRSAALSKQLSPVFEQLLIENALAPHSLWFAKRRFKIGDQLTVAGSSLPMLIAGNAKGSITLTLKSFEPVKGHPCGVFAVTGNFSGKQFPDFEGNFTDKDVSIQSGQLWLSLLYPLILKEETDTIQTTRLGSQDGLEIRGQGSVKVSVIREWKNTEK